MLADEHFDQPGDIDLIIGADLFYDMLRSGRRHVLATTQFYKKQFLAGHILVELQLPQHGIILSLNFCSENTTVLSIIETAPGKWNPWSYPPRQQSNKSVNNMKSQTHPNKMLECL